MYIQRSETERSSALAPETLNTRFSWQRSNGSNGKKWLEKKNKSNIMTLFVEEEAFFIEYI